MREREGWDELVEQKAGAALAPYVDPLPPEVVQEVRAQLEDFVGTHPAMERMGGDVLPASVVKASAEVDADGAPRAPERQAHTGAGSKK